MFELGRVASFDVAQGRISVDHSFVAQILQSHLVLGGAGAIQPALAESQSAEVLVDDVEKRLR